MRQGREGDLERGMELIPKLPEIMPDEADARIHALYDDIQRTLRVPFVNFIFRTLANYPDYFEPAWKGMAPLARTRDFERAADELRARAPLETVPNATVVAWEGLGDMDEIRPFSDSIHYVLPKLLLVATTWDEDLNKSAPADAGRIRGGNDSPEIPLGIAEGTRKIPMVDPESATGRVKELFEDIKMRHDHPGVASYYRSLGHWPEFLGMVWERIRPYVGSREYEERKRTLIDTATRAVRDLTRGRSVAAGYHLEKADELRSILAVFRLKLIPDLLLDVAMIEAMLDGPEAARQPKFSVPGGGGRQE
jgi:hypothetical protein